MGGRWDYDSMFIDGAWTSEGTAGVIEVVDQPNGVGITGVFGGFKQSGVGREWGHHGIEEFTELKAIAWG